MPSHTISISSIQVTSSNNSEIQSRHRGNKTVTVANNTELRQEGKQVVMRRTTGMWCDAMWWEWEWVERRGEEATKNAIQKQSRASAPLLQQRLLWGTTSFPKATPS
jgi:hypothetical protein